jgi:hypothetical protein
MTMQPHQARIRIRAMIATTRAQIARSKAVREASSELIEENAKLNCQRWINTIQLLRPSRQGDDLIDE